VRAGKQFVADDCMGLAQQVAFSSLLAFLPTVVLLIGLLGLSAPGPSTRSSASSGASPRPVSRT
jgi:uncharacterized BrkB/YihY/UPF0761 family membrane protein